MVTETIPVREQEQEVLPILDVREVGERIGIPVVIRPWWGSRRQLYVRRHRKCGEPVHQWGGWWCSHCGCAVAPKNIEVIKLEQGRWVCPAGGTQQLKWPVIDGDKVVMWAGRCGDRYNAGQRKRYKSATHLHRQTLEVLDFSATAMLVRVSVGSRYRQVPGSENKRLFGNHRLNFLIGRDDGHPFVHVVTRHQVTVVDAYDYMVPLSVFNAQMHGFDVKRQGDFFFVPREFWTPRPVTANERRARPWSERRNHPDDGTVFTNASLDGSRHVAELFIWAWPFNLVKGTVTAPDHPPLELATWHRVIRNKRPPAFNPDTVGDDD